MIGNIINIYGGTNFDTGWYEITAHTDTNTVTLDRTAASGGNGSSGTGNVGGAWKFNNTNDTTFFSSTNKGQGDTIWLAGGSHSANMSGGAITMTSATNNAIEIFGYNSSRGDEPTGTNRPLVNIGGTTFFGNSSTNYVRMANVRWSITSTSACVVFAASSTFLNCHFTNSGTGHVLQLSSSDAMVGCQFTATNNAGLRLSSGNNIVSGCFFEGGAQGIFNTGSHTGCYVGNVFDGCTTGVYGGSNDHIYCCLNNTFYNCGRGIYGTGAGLIQAFVNNIFHSCSTAGIESTASASFNYFILDYNCWYNNGTDLILTGGTRTKGANAVNADPLLTDPANDDYTLQSGSPAQGTGAGLNLTGATA
jgi:hypothetical protein